MNDKDQNKAIARSQGFQFQGDPEFDKLTAGWYFPEKVVMDPSGNIVSPHSNVPRYTKDLNAAFQLQDFLLKKGKLDQFIFHLGFDQQIKEFNTDALTCATAAQRAEAFLKTLDLWTS